MSRYSLSQALCKTGTAYILHARDIRGTAPNEGISTAFTLISTMSSVITKSLTSLLFS